MNCLISLAVPKSIFKNCSRMVLAFRKLITSSHDELKESTERDDENGLLVCHVPALQQAFDTQYSWPTS